MTSVSLYSLIDLINLLYGADKTIVTRRKSSTSMDEAVSRKTWTTLPVQRQSRRRRMQKPNGTLIPRHFLRRGTTQLQAEILRGESSLVVGSYGMSSSGLPLLSRRCHPHFLFEICFNGVRSVSFFFLFGDCLMDLSWHWTSSSPSGRHLSTLMASPYAIRECATRYLSHTFVLDAFDTSIRFNY
jgi:hypothetical protein